MRIKSDHNLHWAHLRYTVIQCYFMRTTKTDQTAQTRTLICLEKCGSSWLPSFIFVIGRICQGAFSYVVFYLLLLEEEIYLAIFEIFNAGTDATSAVFMWGILYLTLTPAAQEKCRAEILKVELQNILSFPVFFFFFFFFFFFTSYRRTLVFTCLHCFQ